MHIDRRSFIQGGVCVAALLPLSGITGVSAQTMTTEAPKKVRSETGGDSVVFTIYGWDRSDSEENPNQLCLRVTQSWRTAWR